MASTYLTLVFCWELHLSRTGERPSRCRQLAAGITLLIVFMTVPPMWERQVAEEDGQLYLRLTDLYYSYVYKNMYRLTISFLVMQVILDIAESVSAALWV